MYGLVAGQDAIVVGSSGFTAAGLALTIDGSPVDAGDVSRDDEIQFAIALWLSQGIVQTQAPRNAAVSGVAVSMGSTVQSYDGLPLVLECRSISDAAGVLHNASASLSAQSFGNISLHAVLSVRHGSGSWKEAGQANVSVVPASPAPLQFVSRIAAQASGVWSDCSNSPCSSSSGASCSCINASSPRGSTVSLDLIDVVSLRSGPSSNDVLKAQVQLNGFGMRVPAMPPSPDISTAQFSLRVAAPFGYAIDAGTAANSSTIQSVSSSQLTAQGTTLQLGSVLQQLSISVDAPTGAPQGAVVLQAGLALGAPSDTLHVVADITQPVAALSASLPASLSCTDGVIQLRALHLQA